MTLCGKCRTPIPEGDIGGYWCGEPVHKDCASDLADRGYQVQIR